MRTGPLLLGFMLLAGAASGGNPDAVGELRARIGAGDYRGALAAADSILAEEPDSAAALQYRAYALHRLGRSGDAEAAYERCLMVAPENAWAWRNLAELYASERRYREAVPAAERAVTLAPGEPEGWERLTRILRESGDYEGARSGATRALAAGIAPAWCRAELGYDTWALGDLAASVEHWKAARAAGADPLACADGVRIAEWDRPTGPRAEREGIEARRRGQGEEWVFPVGSIEVHTRVGPELPGELSRLIGRIQEEYDRFLDAGAAWGGSTRLFLSRTVEEHERYRERVFPEGYSGRAFFVPARGRGRGGWGGGGRPSLDLYVAYSSPGLFRSLSHELSHVLVHGGLPRARNLPVWLDEGIATYLELAPDEDGRPRSRGVRKDLLAALDAAGGDEAIPTLRALLSSPRETFSGSPARVRYAQAWSLVHFLLHGQSPDGRAKLRALLREVDGAGMRPEAEVFSSVYGADLDRLEADWRAYVAGLPR